MEVTEEQKKLIDLLKTGKAKNVRLAFDLNLSQNLGLEHIYLALYAKWDKFIPKNAKETVKHFPILSTHGANVFTSLDMFEEEDFENGLSGLCEFLIDIETYFRKDDEQKINIRLKTKIVNNDYEFMLTAQNYISKNTLIKKERIFIYGVDEFPF